MAKYDITRRMPYTARQLFDLTCDIARYPEFVPLCTDAWVENIRTNGAVTTCKATLVIEYDKMKLRENFISEVLANADKLTIRAVSQSGPVRHLENRWRFTDIAGTGECDVDFLIDYQMSSRPLQFVVSTMFDYAVRKMMTAFESRAGDLYGRSGQQTAE